MRKLPVIIDVETKYTFREHSDHAKLGISVAGIYDYTTQQGKIFLKKDLKDFLRCLKMHRTSSASTFEVLTWRFFSHITQEICQNSPLWIFLKKLKKKLGVDERFTIF